MSQTYWWHIGTSANTTAFPVERELPGDEREIVHREINFEVQTEGDGRTLYTRIVPYNTPVEVCDPPHYVPYMESWKPGVFDRQLRAANRVDVLLNVEHEKGIGGVVGRGVELRSEPDGLMGTFRLLGTQDGEKTRELVQEKVFTGMSLEALVIKSHRTEEDIVERTEARLKNVAICRSPAFPGAEVLAVRSNEPDEPDEPDEPKPDEPEPGESKIVVPELVARDDITRLLERVGVAQLERKTIVRGSWDADTDRFDDEQYEHSCLIVREGDGPAKERCSLPILEPTGELNATALGIAGRLLPTTKGITNAQRSEAARHLVRLYRLAELEIPASITDTATR